MRIRWCLVPAVLIGACDDAPPSRDVPVVPHETSSSSGASTQEDDASVDATVDAAAPTVPQTYSYELECGAAASYTLEETDALYLTPRCDAGPTTFEGLPDGAAVDASGRLTWVPRLDQAGPFAFDLVDASGARTAVTGWVLDRFDAPGNLPLVNRVHYTQEHGLPVVHLSWHSEEPEYCRDGVARDAVPADILVGSHLHAGAELRCRGKTSLAFPKKSFTLKFSKDDPFRAPAGLERFEGRRRLALTQSFDDNSQLRTRLGFETWNRSSDENLDLDHASVVVFIDGEYQGLYTLTDRIGEHFFEARGLDKRGQLFESIDHRGNYRAVSGGQPKPNVHLGFEKEEGLPEDDFSALDALLHWVSDSTPEAFESTLDSTLYANDFIDWYVFATAIMARDSYAKNSYVYQDTDGPDLRWRYVPWDMNDSFGQDWTSGRIPFDLEGKRAAWPTQRNGIWERLVTQPALAARVDARYAAALAGPLSRASMLALFDQLHAEVRPSALRDERKWDAARREYPLWATRTDFTDFDAESTYVRAWINQRWQFLETLY